VSKPVTPGSGNKYVTPGSGSGGDLPNSNISRVLPRQLSTGTMRGTQTVGYGNTKIDGSNNRITIGDSIVLDGDNDTITVTNDTGSTLGVGAIPGTNPVEFGFFSTDDNGKLIMKIVNGTWYTYNITDDTNVMQAGVLPDASYGWAVAAEGNNVADGYA